MEGAVLNPYLVISFAKFSCLRPLLSCLFRQSFESNSSDVGRFVCSQILTIYHSTSGLVINCSQTKFVTWSYAIFCLTDFSSHPFGFSCSKVG